MPKRASSALALAALLAAGAAQATTYNHVTLIDGTGAAPKPDMAIVVEGERIAAIVPAVAPGKDVVEMHGAFALPGMINTHVHLATWPNVPFAQASLRRDLYDGVTAVRDMAGDTRELGYLKRSTRIGDFPGPDIYYASLMAGPEFFHDPRTVQATMGGFKPGEVPWMRAISRDTDLPLAIAEAKGTGATAIKIYADLPAPLVRAITGEAHRQHLMVWAHGAVFPASPRDGVDAGVDAVSHVCMLGYQASAKMPPTYHNRPSVEADKFKDGTAALDALFADMKRRGTVLDATLYVYEVLDHMKNATPPPYCTLALAQKMAAGAYRAGVAISAGTDADSDWHDPHTALIDELGLLVHGAGMTPMDAIRSATAIAARTIGQAREMGTLEKGKLANIAFVAKDPLADIANLKSIQLTVKRGRAFPRKDFKPITKDEAKYAD
ncbi:MAG TPA: amidohydrolase family protein [Rhizomicrobium sp.]|nr:amidohydrolase family protein [Rhizomicrobium sp.]